jgi:hypothetical protein
LDLGEENHPCKQAIVCAGGGLSRQAHLEKLRDRSHDILFIFLEFEKGTDTRALKEKQYNCSGPASF